MPVQEREWKQGLRGRARMDIHLGHSTVGRSWVQRVSAQIGPPGLTYRGRAHKLAFKKAKPF